MSSDYRMNLIWTSHGEQLRADLERNIGGLTGFRGELSRNSSQLGTWGQQLRAISTTLRYAFAGAIVYGVATAINSLSDFEAKLGDIDSLAAQLDRSGNLRGLGSQLEDVGDFALRLSNRLGVAASDIQDNMAAFYSSFQPPQGPRGLAQMKEFVTTAAELARVAEGADPRALADALAGMVYAFAGGDIKQTQRLGSLLAGFQQISVGYTGQAISRDVGRISASAKAGNLTPEEAFAFLTAASQSGGSTSVITRGTSQLFNNLLNPRTKTVRTAYAQAGLPTDPRALQGFTYKGHTGGLAILMRMFDAVGPVSFRNARALSDESFDNPQDALNAAGGRGGNLRLAFNLFGRQESLRQFLNVLSRGPGVVDTFINTLEKAEKNDVLAQRARLAVNQSELQRAKNAQQNFNMQLIRGFDPVLHTLSRGLTGISNFSLDHRTGVTAAISGAAGAQLAARVFAGTGIFGLAGRGINRIPGVNRILTRNPLVRRIFGGALSQGGELAAASVVGSGLGAFSSSGRGTRTDPVWTVIDPLSWFMPGAPRGGVGGGPGDTPGGGGRRFVPPWLSRGLLRGGGAVALLAGADIAAHELQGHLNRSALRNRDVRVVPGGFPLLKSFSHPQQRGTGLTLDFANQPNAAQQKILDAYTSGRITPTQAEARLSRLEERAHRAPGGGTGLGFVQQVEGQAAVDVWLRATPELAKALRGIDEKNSVPVKLWSASSGGGKPQHRGKNKTTRGQGSR